MEHATQPSSPTYEPISPEHPVGGKRRTLLQSTLDAPHKDKKPILSGASVGSPERESAQAEIEVDEDSSDDDTDSDQGETKPVDPEPKLRIWWITGADLVRMSKLQFEYCPQAIGVRVSGLEDDTSPLRHLVSTGFGLTSNGLCVYSAVSFELYRKRNPELAVKIRKNLVAEILVEPKKAPKIILK